MDELWSYVVTALGKASVYQQVGYVATAIAAIVGVPIALIRLATAVLKIKAAMAAKRLQKALQDTSEVSSSFTKEEISSALTDYIVPDCAQTDPSNEVDLRYVADVRESVVAAMDRFLGKGGDKRFILLLADSGMGKTTFCLNYYQRLTSQREPIPAAIVSLGRPYAIENIRAVKNRKKAVLILDAFDEDLLAIENSSLRLYDLMKAASDFRAVILTCRSQFFLNDASVPTETGVAVITPRKGGEEAFYKFYKLYLLPFSENQIDEYVRRKFRWWTFLGFTSRAAARRLIDRIPELSVRPMLLALIPDLIQSKAQITRLFELYAFMVEKWLRRESNWISEDTLLAISKDLAVFLYTGKAYRKDRVTLEELTQVARSVTVEDQKWQHLTSRSLLNRDSDGFYKFAHRSIMEYLFVRAAIDGQEGTFSVYWTDLMRELFVSWGSTREGKSQTARAREILRMDLRTTGLIPLSPPLATPSLVPISDLTKEAARGKGRRLIPLAWRSDSLRIQRASGHVILSDFQYDLTWRIPSDIAPDERSVFRLSYKDVQKLDEADPEFRLPSLEEFYSLIDAEAVLNSGELIDKNEIYWMGDQLGKSRPLVISFQAEQLFVGMIRVAEITRQLSHTSIRLFAFEINLKNLWKSEGAFSARVIRVREGQAEEYFHRISSNASHPSRT